MRGGLIRLRVLGEALQESVEGLRILDVGHPDVPFRGYYLLAQT